MKKLGVGCIGWLLISGFSACIHRIIDTGENGWLRRIEHRMKSAEAPILQCWAFDIYFH